MVTVAIYSMGAVSGAHLNPAVSFAFALRRNFPWRRVPAYVVTQISGASIATLLLLEALFGPLEDLGATKPGANVTELEVCAIDSSLRQPLPRRFSVPPPGPGMSGRMRASLSPRTSCWQACGPRR